MSLFLTKLTQLCILLKEREKERERVLEGEREFWARVLEETKRVGPFMFLFLTKLTQAFY